MLGYYAKFLEHVSEHKVPLNKLLRKGHVWDWGNKQEDAFETLKVTHTTVPVLARPEFSKPFNIQCDARGRALGSVL